MNVLARQNGAEAVALVRQRWHGLEGEWMLSAYEMAREGKRLMDAGECGRAEEILTRYVSENVGIMLDTLEELVETIGERVGTGVAGT